MPLPEQWTVVDGVYEPREDSFLLQDALQQAVEAGDRVLDVGTGSGILAWTAAEAGAQVTAVDVNPAAVDCAQQNLAGTAVTVVESDLFAAVDGAFDLIVCNPPYVPVDAELGTMEERAWAGGEKGRALIDRFIDAVPAYLAEGGRVLLLQSSKNGVAETIDRFQEAGLDAETMARENVPWEELVVIHAAARSE